MREVEDDHEQRLTMTPERKPGEGEQKFGNQEGCSTEEQPGPTLAWEEMTALTLVVGKGKDATSFRQWLKVPPQIIISSNLSGKINMKVRFESSSLNMLPGSKSRAKEGTRVRE